MAEIIPNSSNKEPISTAPVQPSSSNPATAEAAAATSGTKKEFTMSTSFNSMKDLKEKAPEFYDKMMEGIAMTIIKDMRRHQERLKKLMRKAREQR